MRLHVFRHLWGLNGSWEVTFPAIQAQNCYQGIEALLPPKEQTVRFEALLEQFAFDYIPIILTSGETPAEHVASFEAQLRDAARFRPRLVTCHSGQDRWTFEESCAYFAAVLAIETQFNFPVAHETHRGRILFNPWVTDRLLRVFPTLKLCGDFSHWICVAERLLTREGEMMARCADACLHLHTRVGYEQGPQVPDPRAPEYARHLDAHESWWAMVWERQVANNQIVTTLTPEFGPPLYQHTLPYTQEPVGNIDEISNWMARRQIERFARKPFASA